MRLKDFLGFALLSTAPMQGCDNDVEKGKVSGAIVQTSNDVVNDVIESSDSGPVVEVVESNPEVARTCSSVYGGVWKVVLDVEYTTGESSKPLRIKGFSEREGEFLGSFDGFEEEGRVRACFVQKRIDVDDPDSDVVSLADGLRYFDSFNKFSYFWYVYEQLPFGPPLVPYFATSFWFEDFVF